MKIEVSNKKFSGEQNGFHFVKGFAEVKEGDEAKAKRIANVLGYKIIEGGQKVDEAIEKVDEAIEKESKKAPAKAKAPAKPKAK